jgi:hypothetical protein
MRVSDTAAAMAGRVGAALLRFDDALRRARLGRHEAPPPLPAGAPQPDALLDPPPVPELAAAVRALPAAVEAVRAREGGLLALSFGRSLEVELRSGRDGVELVLRPEPRLGRAAAEELPRIVAALRARGITVARAEVRSQGGARRGAR